MTDIPRRARLDLNTPAELAIRAAVAEVEKVGADIGLTQAVILLGQAREFVADYVDARATDRDWASASPNRRASNEREQSDAEALSALDPGGTPAARSEGHQ